MRSLCYSGLQLAEVVTKGGLVRGRENRPAEPFKDDRPCFGAPGERERQRGQHFVGNRAVMRVTPHAAAARLTPAATRDVQLAHALQRIEPEQLVDREAKVAALAIEVMQIEQQKPIDRGQQLREKAALVGHILPAERKGQVLESHRSEEHTSELQSLRHLVCRL